MQYGFAPEHPFPAQLEDAQAAVRWLPRHAEEFGVDPQRIGAGGGSAGGHLALLLYGDQDQLVPHAQAAAYRRRLRELGIRCNLYTEY